jgi:ribosomal protein S12 methylthiotransferase
MQLQAEIHAGFQQSLVGKTTTVLIDDASGDTAIGRTWADAPEVDGVVEIHDPQHNLSTGAMVEATITSASGYDLGAELVNG